MTNEPENPETPIATDEAPRPPADAPRVGLVSMAYLGERWIRPEVLGAMWAAGKWRYPCPKGCGGTLHVSGIGGSPLSGSGSIWGECTTCGHVKVARGDVRWSGDVLRDGLEHGEPGRPPTALREDGDAR